MNDLVLNGFLLSPTGLSWSGPAPDIADWMALGNTLKTIQRGAQWWLGDWIIAGEDLYADKYAQALDACDYTRQGLRDIRWVCANVHPNQRRDDLSFEHHRKVAALPPAEQEHWLQRAALEEWSASELFFHLRYAQQLPDDPTTPPPTEILPPAPRQAVVKSRRFDAARTCWIYVIESPHELPNTLTIIDA